MARQWSEMLSTIDVDAFRRTDGRTDGQSRVGKKVIV